MPARTDEEIIARIKERKEDDYFGFEASYLIVHLPYELAKPYLTSTATETDWTVAPKDRESILAEMLKYMPFAWEKANDQKGLSAMRTMHHYTVWVWLAGDDLGDLMEYEYYGKDNLVKICDHYGWDSGLWDDGERTNG